MDKGPAYRVHVCTKYSQRCRSALDGLLTAGHLDSPHTEAVENWREKLTLWSNLPRRRLCTSKDNVILNAYEIRLQQLCVCIEELGRFTSEQIRDHQG